MVPGREEKLPDLLTRDLLHVAQEDEVVAYHLRFADMFRCLSQKKNAQDGVPAGRLAVIPPRRPPGVLCHANCPVGTVVGFEIDESFGGAVGVVGAGIGVEEDAPDLVRGLAFEVDAGFLRVAARRKTQQR